MSVHRSPTHLARQQLCSLVSENTVNKTERQTIIYERIFPETLIPYEAHSTSQREKGQRCIGEKTDSGCERALKETERSLSHKATGETQPVVAASVGGGEVCFFKM